MDTLLHVLGLVLLFATCLAGLVSLVFGLPGTFVILVAAFVYAWATDFTTVHWTIIGWLTVLAALGEGLELLAASAGAATADGARPSRRVLFGALAGSFVGGVVGAPLLFGVGALLGALAGAFAGAAIAVAYEGGDTARVLTTGLAALRGRLLGFAVKAAIAVAMIGVVAVAAL